jgi:hypothetical protein
MPSRVSERVRVFLREHVPEFEQLEVLLLAVRERDREWTAEEAALRLGLPADVAREALEHLREHGLLDGRCRYAPSLEGAAEAVAELQGTYETNRLGIVQVMSANALERLRTSTIRTFADAFRLRGDKRDG